MLPATSSRASRYARSATLALSDWMRSCPHDVARLEQILLQRQHDGRRLPELVVRGAEFVDAADGRADGDRAAGERNRLAEPQAASSIGSATARRTRSTRRAAVIGLMPWLRFAALPLRRSCGRRRALNASLRNRAKSREARAPSAWSPRCCAIAIASVSVSGLAAASGVPWAPRAPSAGGAASAARRTSVERRMGRGSWEPDAARITRSGDT